MEIVFLLWTIGALTRTLAYLRSKRQVYKFEVMKNFGIVFALGTIIYVVIRVSKIFSELLKSDQW